MTDKIEQLKTKLIDALIERIDLGEVVDVKDDGTKVLRPASAATLNVARQVVKDLQDDSGGPVKAANVSETLKRYREAWGGASKTPSASSN